METNDIPAVTPVATPAVSLPPGHILREARERLGLSVADVANQIKLAPRQIEALEADDFQHLPEMAFVRGFLRSYAKILQLDVQPLLAALPQAKTVQEQSVPVSVEVPFPSAHSPQRQNLIWLGAALLLSVVVVAFAVWHFTTPQPAKTEVAQVETPVLLPAQMQVVGASPVPEAMTMAASPVVAVPPAKPVAVAVQPPVQAIKPIAQSSVAAASPAKVAAGTVQLPAVQQSAQTIKPAVPSAQPPVPAVKPPVQAPQLQLLPAKQLAESGAATQAAVLRIVFDDESWTEVKDKYGKTLSSQVNPRGSELHLDGRAPFSLVIGHAEKVRVYHKGKQVDLTDYINETSEVARITLE